MGTPRGIVLLEKDVTKDIDLIGKVVGEQYRDFELCRLTSRMSLSLIDEVKGKIEDELQVDLFEEKGTIKLIAYLME